MGYPSTSPVRPRIVATLALGPVSVFFWYIAYYETLHATWFGMGGSGIAPYWAVLSEAFLVRPGPFWLYYVVVLGLWWRTVRWTAWRRGWVLAVTAAVLASSAMCGFWALEGVDERALLYSGLALNFALGPAALVLVAWICYPRPHERADGALRCPRCGYDLRGQRECRCPECGHSFAIGDLFDPDGE